jgi:hypothetical protein
MPVRDIQVATLRAYLAGDQPQYNQLLAQLDRRADSLGYNALVTAAFVEAVERKFGKTSTHADVVDFVADLRSRTDYAAEAVDPRAAERLILEILGQATTDGIDSRTASNAKLLILAGLVADEKLDGARLDEFTAKARKMADYLLG